MCCIAVSMFVLLISISNVYAKAESSDNFSILRLLSPITKNDNVSNIPKPARKPIDIVASSNLHNYKFKFEEVFEKTPLKKPLPISRQIKLTSNDINLYKQVFTLQNKGKWSEADKKISKLGDMRLLGYILYQRYTHPKYNSSETELRDWLQIYPKLAVAKDIYKLANRKFKKTYFPKPIKQKTLAHRVVFSDGYDVKPYRSKKHRSKTISLQIHKLKRKISADLSRDAPTRALKRLEESPYYKYLDRAEKDILKSDIAAAYFYLSLFEKAKSLAIPAAQSSPSNAPLAGWIAGLSYWIEGNYPKAGQFFEKSANATRASEWMRSAASYWAARSYMRAKKPRQAIYWLKQASTYPRSFYGLIATRSLGIKKYKYDWSLPNKISNNYLKKIMETDNGYRAISLMEVEQQNLAIKELSRININNKSDEFKEAVFILANKYNVPNISMQLASSVHRPNGKLYDVALYPSLPWKPEGGFELSPALIHAFIRQESKFNPYAKSRSGAKGLMQLMPKTASYIAGKPNSYFKSKEGQEMLLDPVFNLTLGQRYIKKLLQHPAIQGNMLELVASYNAGPGRVSRWKRKINVKNDPLLFIEMLPAAETRAFVEKVMANYWIYNLRFYGKTPASLQAIATGKWPYYEYDARTELAIRNLYSKYRR